jgi:hypothetical protein
MRTSTDAVSLRVTCTNVPIVAIALPGERKSLREVTGTRRPDVILTRPCLGPCFCGRLTTRSTVLRQGFVSTHSLSFATKAFG